MSMLQQRFYDFFFLNIQQDIKDNLKSVKLSTKKIFKKGGK